jgi:hypothetical protein
MYFSETFQMFLNEVVKEVVVSMRSAGHWPCVCRLEESVTPSALNSGRWGLLMHAWSPGEVPLRLVVLVASVYVTHSNPCCFALLALF